MHTIQLSWHMLYSMGKAVLIEALADDTIETNAREDGLLYGRILVCHIKRYSGVLRNTELRIDIWDGCPRELNYLGQI